MKKIFVSVFLIFVFSNMFSQAFDDFLNDYVSFSSLFLFEKVFVHTDKTTYLSNETINLKVYVWDSKNMKPSKINQIVFVELIDFEKKIITHRNFWVENGVTSGYIEFSDSLPEGNYQLRAFTNSMKNFSSEFFFTKNLYLETGNRYFSWSFFKKAKNLHRKNRNLLVNFNILNNVLIHNRKVDVEFLLTDNLYDTVDANIFVYDNNKNCLFSMLPFSTNLSFLPQLKNSYFLKIQAVSYKNKKINLPIVVDDICPIIDTGKSSFIIYFTKWKNTADSIANTYLVLIENNGKVFYQKYITKNNDTLKIDKELLPEGVLDFVFVNKSGEVEFFRRRNNFLQKKSQNYTISKSIVNDSLQLKINKNIFSDTAFLSISVSDEKSVVSLSSYVNFFSYLPYNLFLYIYSNVFDINQPFEFPFKQKPYKYDLNLLDSYLQKDIVFLPKSSISISGFVSNILEKIPAKNADIFLSILNQYNDNFHVKANMNGYFLFDSLMYSDTIEYLIEARTRNGKKHTVIYVDEYDTLEVCFFPFLNTDLSLITYNNLEGNRSKNKSSTRGTLYSYADQIIYSDEISNSGQNSVLNILQGRVPGYRKVGSSSIMRGFSSIMLPSEPLYLLNNVPVSVETIESLNLDDIDRIEIVKNSSQTAIYGSRGANGIISVYTKNGYNIKWGEISGFTLGYATNKKLNSIDEAFWQPDIVLTDSVFSIMLPYNSTEKYFVSIQGFSNNGDLIDFQFELGN